MRQTKTRYIGVHHLFTLHAQKRYLTVYLPRGPLTPANGCHATSTSEAHMLHGVVGPHGAQAVRDLRTSRKSWVQKLVRMSSSRRGETKLLYHAERGKMKGDASI
jgi:hypothetical protein